MSIESLLTQGISASNQAMGIAAGNVSKKGSTHLDASIVPGQSGSLNVQITPRSNPSLLKSVLTTTADAGRTQANFEYNEKLNSIFGDPNSSTSMSSTLNSLVAAFEKAITPDAKPQIIAAATAFTSSINNYATQLQSTSQTLQQDIQTTASDINNITQSLSIVNQKIGANSDQGLRDEREGLLSQLASLISIQTSYTSDGKLNIRTQNGAQDLVVENRYAQISYTQNTGVLASDPNTNTIVTFQYYDVTTNNPTFSIPVKVNDLTAFGGKFAGLLDVSQSLLPNALKSINDVATQLKSQFNKLHNSGSGYPPATSFTSSETMHSYDVGAYSGTVNFALTNLDGSAAKDAQGNYLKPMTLNFANISSSVSTSGQFAVSDIISEINNIASGYSQTSIGLGEIPGPQAQPKQYLIDQVRMVAPSVRADGSFDFQLELASGSEYDVDFIVEDVKVIDNAGADLGYVYDSSLPSFTLAAGTRAKTAQHLTLNLENAQSNTIRMKLSATGKNSGVTEAAWVQFTLDAGAGNTLPGLAITNQRVEAAPAFAGAVAFPAGDHAAVATVAKLGGSGLISASLTADGYLNIASGNSSLGIIVDSGASKAKDPSAASYILPKSFSEYLHLNDFLVTADDTNPAQTLALRSDLASNPNLISLGQTQLFSADVTSFVGDVAALADFYTAANPADGEFLTINGVTFTFRNVLVGANDVQIDAGGVAATTTTNLLTQLQASTDPRLVDVLTFADDGAAGILITAKQAGAQGNNITISTNVANALKTDATHGTNLAGDVLQGGTYRQVSGHNATHLDKAPTYAYEIRSNSVGIFDKISSTYLNFYNGQSVSSQTISNFFGGFKTTTAAIYNSSKSDNKVSEKTLEALTLKYSNEVKNTKDNEDASMLDYLSAAQKNERFLALIGQHFKVQDALTALARGR
jgi:flagellar hook-associated protein 1 FlgK